MKASEPQLRAQLDAPSGAVRLFLFHGPDEAAAREWAARLERAMGPDAERVDLEGSMLKSDPGRLMTEAASMSLFGGARHIRLTGVGEESLEAITLLLDAERAGNPVVAFGPALKSSGKLLKLALAAPAVMSFACYLPDAAQAERIATAMALEHGLRANREVARRLVAAAGNDRAVLAREIEKIALYLDAAPDRPGVIDDAVIDAIGADLGEGELSRTIDAAIDGRSADLGIELARLQEANISPIPVLRGLVRRLMTLAELRAEVDAGSSIDEVIERHRIFFREKASTARALRLWNPLKISGAIDHVRRAERAMMAAATAGPVLAEDACLAVARAAGRARAT